MSHFQNYYARQAHGGGMPVFSGASLQRGHGLGNILSSAFRTMVPVIKSAGKTVAKQGLNTGLAILGDVISGNNVKKATKRRLREGGSQLFKKAKTELFSKVSPPITPKRKPIKRRGVSKKSQLRARSRNRKHKKDIFD